MNRLRLTQIFLYRFYEACIPELRLRLGSGVDCNETNPAPISYWFWCQLNYFCSLLTGKHCVANFLLYIVYRHQSDFQLSWYGLDLTQRGFFIQLSLKVLQSGSFLKHEQAAYWWLSVKPSTKTDLFRDSGSWKNKYRPLIASLLRWYLTWYKYGMIFTTPVIMYCLIKTLSRLKSLSCWKCDVG